MTTLEQIQEAQSTLAKLQLQYRDNTREWWALGMAVEFVRVAWYEVSKDPDTAREKFTDQASQALTDYERFTARDDAQKFDRLANENTKRKRAGK
jgi:hypothetical protein